MPLGSVIRSDTVMMGAVTLPAMPLVAEPAEAAAPEVFPEGSGPVVMGVREGTGPLLDMLLREGTGPVAKEGTGPVVDTPFFRDGAISGLTQAPFASNRSSLSMLAIPPPQPTAPTLEVTNARASDPPAAPGADPLPDWLRVEPPARVGDSVAWTGALDHLMPSKLVVGLTRALLARGLLTEEEILAALGQKK